MRSFKTRLFASIVVVGFLVAMPGCGSKVTAENYAKIKDGMTVEQVTDILGKGKESSGVSGAIGDLTGSAKVMKWGDDEKSITITFVNDEVTLKVASGL